MSARISSTLVRLQKEGHRSSDVIIVNNSTHALSGRYRREVVPIRKGAMQLIDESSVCLRLKAPLMMAFRVETS